MSKNFVYIETGEVSYKDKIFVSFISATLATNPLLQADKFKTYFELARFQIVSPDFIVANSPPTVTQFVSEFKIFANELKQVVVAEISDFEN